MPTISAQLTRIKQEKEELKTALEAKGVEVSDDCKIGDLKDHIEIIPSNKMYVCTAVDKATRTWEGQEAVLLGDDSYRYYNFSDTVTTGLKYTSVNPAVGEGWNETCCMRMNSIFQGISTNGLMLYGCWGNGGMPGIQYGHAAMDVNISSGICNASTEVQGVIVAEYKNVTAISQSVTGITGNQPMTIATWYQDLGGTANTLILGLGSKSANKGLFLCSHNGYAAYNLGGTTVSTGVLVNDKLHHICLVYTGSAIGMYIDGELAYQAAASISLTDSPFFFGGNISGTAGSISGFTNMHAYIKHSYVYTRVLSDFDVRALANEEFPSIGGGSDMNARQIYRIGIQNTGTAAITVQDAVVMGNIELNEQIANHIIFDPLESIYLDYYPEHELFGSNVYVGTITEGTEYIVIDPLNHKAGAYPQEDDHWQIIEGGAYFAECYILYYNLNVSVSDPVYLYDYVTIPMVSKDLEYLHHEYIEEWTPEPYTGPLTLTFIPVYDE